MQSHGHQALRAAGVLALALLAAPAAHATTTFAATSDFLDRGTAQAPDADLFQIRNASDAGSGIRIVAVTIDLTAADSNLEDLNPSDSPHVPVFDTLDGCTGGYCYGEETGYPVTAAGGGAATGFVALDAAAQAALEETQGLTLQFNDFDPGELFRFTTDLDDLFDFRISGREFAFSVLSVTFDGGVLTAPVTLSGDYRGDPADLWRAVARVEGSVVPVPAAAWLFGSGLLALGARRLGRRRGD